MIYTKKIAVDLSRQYLNDVIRLHEGDAGGSQIRIEVFDNGSAFDLTSYTVKYDAVIAGYLAEEDHEATVSNNTITVPITGNMCAKSGTLAIDVKIIEGSGQTAKVMFLQKFEAFVQRRVINEDVIIDVSGTTIEEQITDLENRFPIGTDDIADGSVTTAKVERGAITKAKLAADVKEDYMTLAHQVGTMHLAEDLENGQAFLYSTDKMRVIFKIGTESYITLARNDDLTALANLVGNANDLLEAALNYQAEE